MEKRNHNPRVGGSSPSSDTIFFNTINILHRLKKDLEVLFLLHTSYTLFGWLPVMQDYFNSWCQSPILRHSCPFANRILTGGFASLWVF